MAVLSLILTTILSATKGISSFYVAPRNGFPMHVKSSPAIRSLALMATNEIMSDTGQGPSRLVDEILRGNATAAVAAVDALMEVRGTDKMEQYLRDMLPPEKSRLPFWTRLPLTRFSRRARQLRLSRLLELSTPAVDSDDATGARNSIQDDEESKNRRARQALFVLLRNIANDPDGFKGISELLATAKKNDVSSEEMLKRTPDLETPKYNVLFSDQKGYEVRRYDAFSVCSVRMGELKASGSDRESAAKLSNPQLSGASSFGALAGYLFGKNEEEKAMKMTTPVLSEGEGDSRTMSFVLPSSYWKDGDILRAPKPLPDSAVKVSSVDGCERAVLMFSGFGRKTDVESRSKRLREILESDKEWRPIEDAPVTLAQYNDPFTPPWKRRNEVSIPVAPRQ